MMEAIWNLQFDGMTLVFYFIVTILSLTFLWYFVILPPRIRKHLDKLPGPISVPFLGCTWDFKWEHSAFYKQIKEKAENFRDSGIIRLWIGHVPYVIIFQADYVEKLLSSSRLITKSDDYSYLLPWLGTGLLTSTGRKWHERRKLLTPTFHFRILQDFVEVFNEQAEIIIEKLKSSADTGKSVDIFKQMGLCALDIICETAMGKNVNAQHHENSDYVKAVSDTCKIVHRRQKFPFLWPDAIFNALSYGKIFRKSVKILHDFTTNVIKERKKDLIDRFGPNLKELDYEQISSNGKKRLAFLDLLLCSEGLQEEDIREEVDTFMFEGHDTTAAAMTWVCYLLCKHPEIQEKVHEELDAIFGQSPRSATSDDIREMKYLECVIKESLRLFPSVPIFGRILTDNCQFGDYLVPKGTTALVVVPILHTNEHQFPDPKTFNPSRFLSESATSRHPYAYVPFSAGPRNCIGQKFAMMEEKVVLSSILRRFKLELARDDVEPSAELILRPADGVHIKLNYRN
ncbi:DgyrCDS6230 [Dimorphilus gyrociliatus]|uniref:DgyrCDS6230 n=1 Tax=Dimorphilus gyrociliatus TaxID=2664684 RepID=A0A7I8VP32_9ANNE|nr:DgyrCDS6230 [Dimorphilus gyrociliatus]